jgi:hypothetical protein
MGLLITFYVQRERELLSGATFEEKRKLGGTRFINQACTLYKRLLGTSGVLQVQSKLRHAIQPNGRMMPSICASPSGSVA